MRNIVFALLAVNILFFLWPKENQEPRPPLARGQNGLPMLIQLVEVDERPSTSSLVPEEFIPSVQPPPSTVRIAAPKPQYARVKAPDPKKGKNTVSEGFAQAEIESSVPLVSVPVRSSVSPVKAQIGSQSSSKALSCFTLGPFSDKKSADDASSVLRAIGATTSQRIANEKRTRGYWVYLPAQRSRERALKRAEDLAAKGFSDYFVVADGEHDNAISLGLFTLKQGSERRVDKLKSMGFDPRIEVRFTDLSIYWLDYEIDYDLDWAAFQEENFPNGRVDQLKRSCT